MESWIPLIVILALIGAIGWALRKVFRGKPKPVVCRDCGHHGPAVSHTRGSIWMELLLWLLFIIPGVIYSLWRLTTTRAVCQACGSAALVPPGSPAGKRLIKDNPA